MNGSVSESSPLKIVNDSGKCARNSLTRSTLPLASLIETIFRHSFASRADRDDSGNASGDLRFDQFLKCGCIDPTVTEWRDQGCECAAKHRETLKTLQGLQSSKATEIKLRLFPRKRIPPGRLM